MQAAISWSNYLMAVLIVTAGYYIFIGFKFYRKEIADLLSGKWKRSKPINAKEINKDNEDFSGSYNQVMEGSFDELEQVVEDLRRATLEMAGKQTDKDELLNSLKRRLAYYAGLRKSAFRVAINHYIIRQAKETCGVNFTENELNQAWESLLQEQH
jgi:tRNA splicing ligase